MHVLYRQNFSSLLKLRTVLELLTQSHEDTLNTLLLVFEPHLPRRARCVKSTGFEVSSKFSENTLLLTQYIMHGSDLFLESIYHLQKSTTVSVSHFQRLDRQLALLSRLLQSATHQMLQTLLKYVDDVNVAISVDAADEPFHL